MEIYKLYDSEYKFIDLIWEVELMDLSELVWTCFTRFGWPKSITRTALRSLCERGILQVEDSVISARVSKEQVERCTSELIPVKPFRRLLSRFFIFLSAFKNKMKSIMDYKKKSFRIFHGFLVVTIVCGIILTGYLNRPRTAGEIRAAQYAATKEQNTKISMQIEGLVFPDNLIAGRRSTTWDGDTLRSIDCYFEINDKSISANVFDVIKVDLGSLSQNASSIFTQIDSLSSVNFIIYGDGYSGRVVYDKCVDSNDLTNYSLLENIVFYHSRDELNDQANSNTISDLNDTAIYNTDF